MRLGINRDEIKSLGLKDPADGERRTPPLEEGEEIVDDSDVNNHNKRPLQNVSQKFGFYFANPAVINKLRLQL
jgi:hypothetical protein